MIKVHWKQGDGGAFNKVVDNMKGVMGQYPESNIVATCSANGRSLDSFPDKKKVWFGAWNLEEMTVERAKTLKHPNLIIGISKFCADVFKKHADNVYAGQLGVNIDLYIPKPELKSTKFRFLSTCWADCYGRDILLEAWKKAFEFMSGAELVIKSHKGIPFNAEEIRSFEDIDGVKVHQPTGWQLSEQQLVDLYNTASCFVYPVPSIGSSLTVLENMSCGIPPIITNFSAPPEFVDDEVGFLVECDIVPVDCKKAEVYGPFVREPKWGKARVEELVEKMIFAYNHRELLEKKGVAARKKVVNELTWRHAAQKFSNLIEEHLR